MKGKAAAATSTTSNRRPLAFSLNCSSVALAVAIGQFFIVRHAQDTRSG